MTPDETARKARHYTFRLQRAAIVRAYLRKRAWFLVPLCALLVLLLLAIMLAALSLSIAQFPGPSYSLLRLGLFLLACAAWVLESIVVLYLVYIWLEKRAIAASRQSPSDET